MKGIAEESEEKKRVIAEIQTLIMRKRKSLVNTN